MASIPTSTTLVVSTTLTLWPEMIAFINQMVKLAVVAVKPVQASTSLVATPNVGAFPLPVLWMPRQQTSWLRAAQSYSDNHHKVGQLVLLLCLHLCKRLPCQSCLLPLRFHYWAVQIISRRRCCPFNRPQSSFSHSLSGQAFLPSLRS